MPPRALRRDEHRLVGQRAAAEQPPQERCPSATGRRSSPGPPTTGCQRGGQRSGTAAAQRSQQRGPRPAVRSGRPGTQRRPVDRRAQARGIRLEVGEHLGGRGLGDDDDRPRSPGRRRARRAPAGWTGRRPRADRSRPPTPRQWLMPTPAASSSAITCCAPVPLAATSPTGPGATTLAKPRPTPPTTAVPQSGPMTSRSSAAAAVLEQHLVLDGDVVGEDHHRAPAARRRRPRRWRAGRARRRARAWPRRRGRRGRGSAGWRPRPQLSPAPAAAGRQRVLERGEPRADAVVAVGPDRHDEVVGPAPGGTVKPWPRMTSRLSSVAIATCAACTPRGAPRPRARPASGSRSRGRCPCAARGARSRRSLLGRCRPRPENRAVRELWH